jgi:hypothetical protein
MQPDFVITNMGTTVLIRPVTDAAKQWVEDNVETEAWQWLGDAFGVDHRPGWGLVDILEDSGLFVVDVRHPQPAGRARIREIAGQPPA